MAVGIEHRSSVTVLQSFDNWKRPQWGIFAGKEPRDIYEGNNIDESKQYLTDVLDSITESATNTVYTLKSYADDVTHIDSKTPYKSSTTLMLGSAPVTRNDNGTIVIDRTAGVGNRGVGDSGINNAFMQMLIQQQKDLTTKVEKLQTDNFSLQLMLIKEATKAAISGTEKQEPAWWERVIETLDKNPNVIGNIINPIKDAISEFIPGKKKDFIVNTQVSGTQAEPAAAHSEPEPAQNENSVGENKEVEELFVADKDGHRHHPFLTVEERGLSEKQKTALTVERLEKLTEDQDHDIQDAALEAIEARIGIKTVTKMLIAVAMMSDKDLNKLLNHLD